MRACLAAIALLTCASLVAGCGGSHLAAQRAAIAAAARENDNLRIFPTSPGTTTCKVPFSGAHAIALLHSHCTTKVTAHGQGTRVDFIQRARFDGHVQTGDWVYYLDNHNRFQRFRPHGWLPQDSP